MNKEYITFDMENAIVSDENGKLEKRYVGHALQKDMLSENKKELIDNKLDIATKKLNEDKKVKFLAKWMLIFQPILLVVMPILGFIFGGLFHLSNFLVNAIYSACSCFVFTGIAALISTVYWTILSIVYNKKIKKDSIKVDTIKKIQKDYENEENRIQENEYERHAVYPNQIFSLDKDTQAIEERLDEEIEAMYEDDLAVGLTLKRK